MELDSVCEFTVLQEQSGAVPGAEALLVPPETGAYLSSIELNSGFVSDKRANGRHLKSVRQRKTVATAGRSYGGPPGVLGRNFQKLPPNFSEVALMNFPKVAPEVCPAVHTALLCLKEAPSVVTFTF